MNLVHLLFSGRIALEAVSRNPLRAGLTSLGILFGVASVIAMLAIGRGAEQEILSQMRLLGTNNVVITSLIPQLEPSDPNVKKSEEQVGPKRVSSGLTVRDVRSIVETIPEVETASGEVVMETSIFRNGYQRSGKLVGVDGAYFQLVNLPLVAGSGFLPIHLERRSPVVVIGHGVAARFFPGEDPIGRQIKAGDTWFTVVGVVGQRNVSQQVSQKLGVRDPNMDVYVPVATMLLRVRNRSKPKPLSPRRRMFNFARNLSQFGILVDGPNGEDLTRDPDDDESADERRERLNYHQLDRAIVRVRDADYVPAVAEVARRQLTRRHNDIVDFEITVPELLLKQEQRAKTIFNLVLGAIASISLVVGGIGIMNIMLASVLERIREIGVRRAVGASRLDILSQFLSEAVLISLAGGIAGILLGIGSSVGIERFAGIRTSVSPFSVALAFGVSISVGLAFGIVPAWRAAEQDPVVSLRHE